MTIRLTDMQLLTLGAAKQRDGRCIAAPPKLEGDAALEFATRLVAVGVVKKVKAKPGSRVWRRNDATGPAYALELSAAGVKTIAVDEKEAVEAASEISSPALGEVSKNSVDLDSAVASAAPPKLIAVPRKAQNSRRSSDYYGARAARRSTSGPVEWPGFPIPPSALTGLRKRGVEIDRRKAKDARGFLCHRR
jgi:hypothetical protein